jgi:hypothetical protein
MAEGRQLVICTACGPAPARLPNAMNTRSSRQHRAIALVGWLASALCLGACRRSLEGAACPCSAAYVCCDNACLKPNELPAQCLPSNDSAVERDAGAEQDTAPVTEQESDGGADAGRPNAQGYRSGTRLDARFMTSSDGLAQFEFFFDKELDTACTALPAADGTIRCLPQHEPSNVFYADAACERPLIGRASNACGEGSRFYHTRKLDVCTQQFVVMERGERTKTPGKVYVQDSDGACKAGDAADLVLYEMTYVPPDKFVLFATELSEPQAGVRAEYYAGDDGSRMLARYVEAKLGFPCHYLEHNGGELCVEPLLAYVDSTRFADAACTKPVPLLRDDPSGRCPSEKPHYGYNPDWNKSACTLQVDVCLLGDELEKTYYHDAVGMCGAEPGEEWSGLEGRAFACSPRNPWEEFPSVEIVHEGGTRIVAQRHRKGTFPSVEYPYTKLYDRLLELACMPDRAADGKTRCLPFAALGVDYMDAKCTQPVAPRPQQTGCDVQSEKYRALFLPSAPEDCEAPTTRVFEMEEAPVKLAHHYLKLDAETCVEEASSEEEWLRTLHEVPAEDFAELTPAQ